MVMRASADRVRLPMSKDQMKIVGAAGSPVIPDGRQITQ
jgi:hypothetical protein